MTRTIAFLSLLALLSFSLCLPALPEEPAPAPDQENQKKDEPSADNEKQSDKDKKDDKDKDKDKNKYRDKKRNKKSDKKVEKEKPPTDQQLAFKQAEKKLQGGDIIGAWSAFESLAKQDEDKDAAKQAADQLKQIEAKGQDEVKKVLAIDDPTEAEKQLSALQKKYWRTPVKNALTDAMNQIKLKKAQKASSGSSTKAPAAPAPAAAADPNAKPAEGDAKQAADPDELARMWLIIGDIHRVNGRSKDAEASYLKLVFDYPDSRFTIEAIRKLDELRAEKDDAAKETQGEGK